MPGARVENSEAIEAVRAGLIVFSERAGAALASVRQEVQKQLRWLQQEHPQYWQNEERRGFDRVASTRIAYETCRLRTVAGHRSACIEEKVAHQRAQRRLETVQQQIELTRRWGQQVADQSQEFFARLTPLERQTEENIPRMVALLERMLTALDAYADKLTDDASVSAGPAEVPTPAAPESCPPAEPESSVGT